MLLTTDAEDVEVRIIKITDYFKTKELILLFKLEKKQTSTSKASSTHATVQYQYTSVLGTYWKQNNVCDYHTSPLSLAEIREPRGLMLAVTRAATSTGRGR